MVWTFPINFLRHSLLKLFSSFIPAAFFGGNFIKTSECNCAGLNLHKSLMDNCSKENALLHMVQNQVCK